MARRNKASGRRTDSFRDLLNSPQGNGLPNEKSYPLGRDENAEILNSSIFVFCPKGLYNVETSRTYTASICGAIPIILCSNEEWNEIYPYYDIEPPWLHTNSVENIVSIINELLANPQELYKIQKNIIKWTSDIKKEIYLNINNTVTK